jgi:hypothetical protein
VAGPAARFGSPLVMSDVTVLANSDSSGYIRRSFVDPDDGDTLGAVGREVHRAVRSGRADHGARPWSVAVSCCSRRRAICRASSVRPRLIRDLTVPSGTRSFSANLLIAQLLDVAQHHGRAQRRRQLVERRAQQRDAVAPLERCPAGCRERWTRQETTSTSCVTRRARGACCGNGRCRDYG